MGKKRLKPWSRKKWGPGNPLYDWQQRKLNKSAKRHKSPVRPMAKRRYFGRFRRCRRSGGTSIVQTGFKIIRITSLFAPALATIIERKDEGPSAILSGIVHKYTGYNMGTGAFEWNMLAQGWTPYVATLLITKGVQKLGGVIRKI